MRVLNTASKDILPGLGRVEIMHQIDVDLKGVPCNPRLHFHCENRPSADAIAIMETVGSTVEDVAGVVMSVPEEGSTFFLSFDTRDNKDSDEGREHKGVDLFRTGIIYRQRLKEAFEALDEEKQVTLTGEERTRITLTEAMIVSSATNFGSGWYADA